MISIIIPTLNEAQHITDIIRNIKTAAQSDDYELIVSDGESLDNTITTAKSICDKVVAVASEPGRGNQLNEGAMRASGDIFLFVHADTLLPVNFDVLITDIMDNKGPDSWGFFNVKLSGSNKAFRVIEKFINIRSRLTSISTGDQCLFLTKDVFKKISGFKKLPIMEDVDISKRLKFICNPVIIPTPVVTSSRRWEQYGIIRTVLLMWVLRFMFFIGVNPDTLKSYYK